MSEFDLKVDEIESMRVKAHKSKTQIAKHFGWTPNYVYQLFGNRQKGKAVQENLNKIQRFLAEEIAERYKEA
ncbi:hypothetical protein JK159_08390 [Weissella minor]|uniref:hypothetical protein n=1 Tax=Weissella minor TaxID=1620 RepID=UPI001BAF6B38|nr:hypothetical protein [Weissella minor]MBS0950373.1 hypothetical protein [Weissella minor]